MKRKADSFRQALKALEQACESEIKEDRDVSGIIHEFVVTFEVCWKFLKAYLESEGHETSTARSVFKTAYQLGIIDNENAWLEMIENRNLSVHTYNKALASDMVDKIKNIFLQEFLILDKKVVID